MKQVETLKIDAADEALRSFKRVTVASILVNTVPLLLGIFIGISFNNVSEGRYLTADQLFIHNFRVGMLSAVGGWVSFGSITLLVILSSSIISGFTIGANISAYGLFYVVEKIPHFLPETLGLTGFTIFGMTSIAFILDVTKSRISLEKSITTFFYMTITLAVATILLGAAAIIEEGAM